MGTEAEGSGYDADGDDDAGGTANGAGRQPLADSGPLAENDEGRRHVSGQGGSAAASMGMHGGRSETARVVDAARVVDEVGPARAGAPCAGEAARPRSGGGVAFSGLSRAHLPTETVHRLRARPGLGRLRYLLGVAGSSTVPVTTTFVIDARLPGGCRERLLVMSSPRYRVGPWRDHVAYMAASGTPVEEERYGQVLLLLRQEEGDVAVVAGLLPMAVQVGPMPERGCTQLRLALEADAGAGQGGVDLGIVPVEDLLRVIHVVPGFADLRLRCGSIAAPAEKGGSCESLSGIRHYLNAFLPCSGRHPCT